MTDVKIDTEIILMRVRNCKPMLIKRGVAWELTKGTDVH